MRLSHIHKLVFFSIPKTGSLSGWKFMEKEFNAKASTIQHAITIPRYAEDYKKFTFIRNPYTRFMSIYHSIVVLGGPKGKYKKNYNKLTNDDSVLGFAKALQRDTLYKAGQIEWKLVKSQNQYLNTIHRIDIKLIHIENATKEFNDWFKGDKIYKVPHHRKRNHLIWNEVKTKELINLVNNWAGKDFEMGNYEKE